jgi:hypothetical protein
MEAEAAKEMARAKAEAERKKKEIQEAIEFGLTILGLLVALGLIVWGSIYFYLHCNKYGCT